MELTTLINGKEVLDTRQVLKLTGYSNTKLHELMRYEKFVNPLKYKNKNFWYKSDIEEYLETTRR
jgi:predicted DNA-binding transcriptional regulator AlpA